MSKPYTAFPAAEIEQMRREAAPYDDAETLDVSAGCFRRLLTAADHRAKLLAALKDAQDAFKRYDLANIGSASIVANAIAKAEAQ